MRTVRPDDLAGLAGGLRASRRPQRRDGYWLWIGGPVPPGYSGLALGPLVIVRRGVVNSPGFARLLRHELVHVRQWRLFGPVGFLRRYLGAYLRWRVRGYPHAGAYRRIPAEIEANWEAGA